MKLRSDVGDEVIIFSDYFRVIIFKLFGDYLKCLRMRCPALASQTYGNKRLKVFCFQCFELDDWLDAPSEDALCEV